MRGTAIEFLAGVMTMIPTKWGRWNGAGIGREIGVIAEAVSHEIVFTG